MYPRKIKNFNAFIGAVSYFGRVTEGKLPELKLKNSDYRGGGMDAPVAVPMGQEMMEAELTFAEWNAQLYKAWGNRDRIVMRPAAQGEEDFGADTYIFTMAGRIKDVTGDPLKVADDASLKLVMAVDYFKVELNGETLIDIDVENAVRIVAGVDQMAAMRVAMGI